MRSIHFSVDCHRWESKIHTIFVSFSIQLTFACDIYLIFTSVTWFLNVFSLHWNTKHWMTFVGQIIFADFFHLHAKKGSGLKINSLITAKYMIRYLARLIRSSKSNAMNEIELLYIIASTPTANPAILQFEWLIPILNTFLI